MTKEARSPNDEEAGEEPSSFDLSSFLRASSFGFAVFIILAFYGWVAHARREIDPTPLSRGDQAAYLAYARQMYDTHYAVAGDRNRMPVFPFLLSLVYRPGMSDAEFLARAQSFNIDLSILLLGLFFLMLRRFFASFYSVALLVVAAFGVFVYRAETVEVEPLYYFLGFFAFILLLRMLIAPRWWLAMLAGAATALAYLTKASMLPTIAIWSVVFAAQAVWECRSRGRLREIGWRFGHLLLVLGTFATLVFPYERTSKRLYGHYFFNVNSAYYMWCDSWPEAVAFTKAYRDNPDFPPDQRPSPAKYWREHSAAQIAGRFLHGLKTFATRSAKPTGYHKFVLFFALVGTVLAARRWPLTCGLIKRELFLASFCFVFFLCYVLLYAWYDAVVTDSRFLLSLFLPLLFAASRFVLGLGEDRSLAIMRRRLSFADLVAASLICLALIDVAYNLLRIGRLIS
jgi:hypothetical protein